MTHKQLLETYNRLHEIHRQKALLEEEETLLKSKLASSIPPGEVRAGILHTERHGKVVAWSKAFEEVVRELIPKTKAEAASTIVEKHTKETVAHIFKLQTVA
jgi:hypothetical protein